MIFTQKDEIFVFGLSFTLNSCYIYHSVSSFTPRAWFSASGYKDCSRPRQGGETVGFRWVFCHLQCRIFKLNNEGHSLTKKRFWVTLRVYWYSTMLLLVSLLCCCTRSEGDDDQKQYWIFSHIVTKIGAGVSIRHFISQQCPQKVK